MNDFRIYLRTWLWKRLPKFSRRQIAFWAATLSLSIGLFFFVQTMIACWRLTALPGILPDFCASGVDDLPGLPALDMESMPQEDALPVSGEQEIELPRWDGGSRVNIVFFGLRGGKDGTEGCPSCTDTIILLTVDPITKTAGMLSIPRDMWVKIPRFGYNRINTAWSIGENVGLPEGGPGLAMETVSQFVGVPIHYYVQVDFDTFVSVIDLIGGIDIYSDEDLILDPMGEGKDHFKLTCCGLRHMDGRRALAYARCRKESQGCTGGDMGRAKRQQKVIMAVRDRMLNPVQFPKLLVQAPLFYETFSSGIHTNMSIEDGMKLAVLARDIPLENIRQGVIDSSMAVPATATIDGAPASVLRPVPDLIRILRDEMFLSDGPVRPLAQGDATSLIMADDAKIRIVNNTYVADLDKRAGRFLVEQGLQVVDYGLPTGTAQQTVLVVYAPKLYALRYLMDAFGVNGSNQVVIKYDPAATVDIELRIGEDWVSKLPPGY